MSMMSALLAFGVRWLPVEVLIARMRQVGTVGRASMYIADLGTWTLNTSKMIITSLSDDADFLRQTQSIITCRRFFKT